MTTTSPLPRRCAWTGVYTGDARELRLHVPALLGGGPGLQCLWVSPQYEEDVRRFVHHAERFGGVWRVMVALVLAGTLAGVTAGLLGWGPGFLVGAASVVLAGVTLFAFPFATPQALPSIGMRASRTLGRVGGVLVAVVGLGVLLRVALR